MQKHRTNFDTVHRSVRGKPAVLDTRWSLKLSDLKVTDISQKTTPVYCVRIVVAHGDAQKGK